MALRVAWDKWENTMQADYSKAALFRFITTAQRQGLFNANYAGAFRAAASKLLEDVGDDVDVRNTDVKAATIRYHNKHPGDLTPGSLGTYQKRLTRVLRAFVEYTENPASYKPRGRGASPKADGEGPTRTPTKSKPGRPGRANASKATQESHTTPTTTASTATATSLAMTYPLRENFVAQVVLPRNMTGDEARKLCAFIRTLAVDFKPQD
jgi:hypothetical protein